MIKSFTARNFLDFLLVSLMLRVILFKERCFVKEALHRSDTYKASECKLTVKDVYKHIKLITFCCLWSSTCTRFFLIFKIVYLKLLKREHLFSGVSFHAKPDSEVLKVLPARFSEINISRTRSVRIPWSLSATRDSPSWFVSCSLGEKRRKNKCNESGTHRSKLLFGSSGTWAFSLLFSYPTQLKSERGRTVFFTLPETHGLLWWCDSCGERTNRVLIWRSQVEQCGARRVPISDRSAEGRSHTRPFWAHTWGANLPRKKWHMWALLDWFPWKYVGEERLCQKRRKFPLTVEHNESHTSMFMWTTHCEQQRRKGLRLKNAVLGTGLLAPSNFGKILAIFTKYWGTHVRRACRFLVALGVVVFQSLSISSEFWMFSRSLHGEQVKVVFLLNIIFPQAPDKPERPWPVSHSQSQFSPWLFGYATGSSGQARLVPQLFGYTPGCTHGQTWWTRRWIWTVKADIAENPLKSWSSHNRNSVNESKSWEMHNESICSSGSEQNQRRWWNGFWLGPVAASWKWSGNLQCVRVKLSDKRHWVPFVTIINEVLFLTQCVTSNAFCQSEVKYFINEMLISPVEVVCIGAQTQCWFWSVWSPGGPCTTRLM